MKRTGAILVCGALLVAAMALVARASAVGQPAMKPQDYKVGVAAKTPRMIAIRYRHNLCPYCRAYEPEFDDALREASAAGVLFVSLDLTNAQTQSQSGMLLAALGLAEHWPRDLTALGKFVFIEPATRNVILTTQLTNPDNAIRELRAGVQEALSRLP